ncbi:MAG: hypothetical protein NVSMB51_08500 [Solirubrobacteraceae bacterium]
MRRRLLSLVPAAMTIIGCGAAVPARLTAASSTKPAAPPAAELAAATGHAAERVTPPAAAAAFPRPPIIARPIPFGPRRRAETVAYVRRHYGSFVRPTYRLHSPQVIVEHFTETPSFGAAFNTFAPDQPDSELHELPGTCAHFVIDRGGRIFQLVPIGIICRHTVGLNWTAVGIEHVAFSDAQLLGDRAQLRASLQLTCWLRSQLQIRLHNVIGHNESLTSPFHREDVARLRSQTHNDLAPASMRRYRAELRRTCGA